MTALDRKLTTRASFSFFNFYFPTMGRVSKSTLKSASFFLHSNHCQRGILCYLPLIYIGGVGLFGSKTGVFSPFFAISSKNIPKLYPFWNGQLVNNQRYTFWPMVLVSEKMKIPYFRDTLGWSKLPQMGLFGSVSVFPIWQVNVGN